MITVKVYKNGNKIKSRYCLCPDGYIAVNNQELFQIIKDYPGQDIRFTDVKNKKDITRSSLIGLIKSIEISSTTPDVDLTNIIRMGGFIKYIKHLESVAK